MTSRAELEIPVPETEPEERTEETEEVNTGNPNHSPHHTSDSKLCTNVNRANINVFQIEEN